MTRSIEHISRGFPESVEIDGVERGAGDDPFGPLLERAVWVAPDGVALVRRGRVCWANPALHSILAARPDSLVGEAVDSCEAFELSDSGTAGRRVLLDLDVDPEADLGRPRRLQLRRADGSMVAVAVSAERLQAVPDGYWALRIREIAAHVRVDEALRTSEARFRALADKSPSGVFLSDVGVRLAYVNPRFEQVWGRESAELIGDSWLAAVLECDRERALTAVGQVLAEGEGSATFRVLRPDGDVRTLDVQMARVIGVDRQASFVGSVEDVTDARAREAALEWQARHDALTGLPNRIELWDRIHQRLGQSDPSMSLVFFDVDDFKLVNDSLGHHAGDALLQIVARRLVDAVRPADVVARFGGDEFVVFCPGVADENEAKGLAERLLAVVRVPAEVAGRQIRVTASAGVLVSGPHHRDAEALIRDADVAMYQAKSAGKARAAMFDASARRDVEHRMVVVSDLRRALAEGGVSVHYQPIFRLDGLGIVGAEALLRYVHPDLGPVPANEVVEIAELSGCIVELGAYVLERACSDLALWRARVTSGRPEYVTVNISAAQLMHPDFEDHVRSAVLAHGLEPSDLCLELTESQLMTDVDTAERVLGSLAEWGARIAIDDFGTGYSSLAYLRRFPVSLVKIERSFVSNPHDPFVAAIVEAVVAVTRAIGGKVVAEGVETIAQLHTVGELGCSLIQGYLLARPGPAEDLPTVTDSRSRTT